MFELIIILFLAVVTAIVFFSIKGYNRWQDKKNDIPSLKDLKSRNRPLNETQLETLMTRPEFLLPSHQTKHGSRVNRFIPTGFLPNRRARRAAGQTGGAARAQLLHQMNLKGQ